jgi:xylitol oxidase
MEHAVAFPLLALSSIAYLHNRRTSSPAGPSRPGAPFPNWASNVSFSPASLLAPTTTAELCALVCAHPKLRVLGSAHSFSSIASSPHALLRVDRLTDVPPPHLHGDTGVLWVPGAATYGAVCVFLRGAAWALPNLASLPHITVAGSIATATHGSGLRNGNLATHVVGLELVSSSGGIVRASRATHGALFDGMVVSLGALGVVLRVALQLVPAFELRQDVYEGLPLDAACAALPAVLGAAYSVSLFTTWGPEGVFEQVWLKRLAAEGDAPAVWMGARRAARQLHPIPGADGGPCTPQLGAPGPAAERLPHFRFEFQPSAGEELQSEYFVALGDAPAALRAVAGLARRVAPLLHISEVRAVAGDDLWLSTAHGRDSVAIHFTWKKREAEVRELLPDLEAALAPFGARPHWGKLSARAGAPGGVAALFPKLREFLELRRDMDPAGKFLNEFLEAALGL